MRHHQSQHPSWGPLRRGAAQFLLTHRADLTHEQRHALVEHIESVGCHIAGYLPDHTLLVVGDDSAAAAAATHEQVVGSALHEPVDKLAPEWRGVLAALAALALDSSGSDGRRSSTEQQQHWWTDLVVTALEQGLEQLDIVRDAAGQALVGARVAFPLLLPPREHARPHELQRQQARVKRLAEAHAAYDAGAAAAAEWGVLLQRHYGATVTRTAQHLATVRVPPLQLPALLDWLTAHPLVHWVEPVMQLHFNNKNASAIMQSGQAAPVGAANTNLNPSVRPIWAAGITGANQIIGLGDTGLGEHRRKGRWAIVAPAAAETEMRRCCSSP